MKLLILVALIGAICSSAHADETDRNGPQRVACYYLVPNGATAGECGIARDMALTELKAHSMSCSYVIYLVWEHDSGETIRCRGFEGGTIDYATGADGHLHFVR